ncbi:DUF4402 domain-containing protein [Sphingobium nicotianae]|uniref:DUF4402 domain-containing protein n=1 Tax=Sphingobium nicotianae TaxID=2782607 RepID=A0A9X1ISE2_9SPHN|nr:DUF4402 domain-containing protein [Sphingobium nicotianae]MBT2188322.1 DUF4402 domain-containing protein [Sphingobium nicotianae]
MNSILSSLCRRSVACLAVLAAAAAPLPAQAQTISITAVDAGAPDLGVVISAASGDTIFRIAPGDGLVTKLSGGGLRPGSGTARGHVTLTCTGSDSCESASQTVTIGASGTLTGRARALTNFTIAPGSNPPTLGTPSGTNTISFTVSSIPRDASRDFYVGADFGIAADGTSGLATSGFLVDVPAGAIGGTAQATVRRPISLTKTSDLSFGTIAAPTSGSGTVTFDAGSGALEVTGTGARVLTGSGAALAQYTVAGESGQSFSIDMTPLEMTGAVTLPVTLNNDAAATPLLAGSPNDEGSYSFRIGGSFSVSHDTPAGLYSGDFVVTVLYD